MDLMKDITLSSLIKVYKKKDYPLYERGSYNLNIFGVRKNENISNKFNDIIGLLYKVNDTWILKKYKATTDPGLYYRENPINARGTAILKEGYYKAAFRLGYHQGKYQALVQNKELTLYRDNDKDDYLDKTVKTYNEIAGINIHRATGIKGNVSENVDKWSAGCQVIASYDNFEEFMKIVNKSASVYGSTFSYALFNESDF